MVLTIGAIILLALVCYLIGEVSGYEKGYNLGNKDCKDRLIRRE